MPIRYFSDNGRFQVDFTVNGNQELFEAIANFQEIFEEKHVVIDGVEVPDSDTKFRVRGSENRFYEKVYVGLDPRLQGYKLDYFNGDNDRLFPKRKDKDGNLMSNNGWYRYEASEKKEVVPKAQKTSEELSKNAPY